MRARAVAFIRLSRLHFLIGGVLMFALGAFASGANHVTHYLAAQLLVSASQLTAHYVNEYADYEADLVVVNRTSFSGGSGVLGSGLLPRRVALYGGIATTTVALLAAAGVALFSPWAALLGLLALTVSWVYSMPPVRLLSTGLGEIATALTVAGLVPLIGSLSQRTGVPDELWWMMCVLVLAQFAMLLAFELPDLESDALAGKRVLGVRLGSRPTHLLMSASFVAAALVDLVAWTANGLDSWRALGAALGAPAAAFAIVMRIDSHHSLRSFLAVAAFFLTGFGLFAGVLATP